MKSSKKDIEWLVEKSKNNPMTKVPGMRFVATGEGCTHQPYTPTPEQTRRAKEHIKELEKEWGVKFKPYPIPGGL